MSNFEAYYIVKVGLRRDEAASAASGAKKFVAVHVELELHKKKADSLDEALQVSQKKFATVKDISKNQRLLLCAAGARLAE